MIICIYVCVSVYMFKVKRNFLSSKNKCINFALKRNCCFVSNIYNLNMHMDLGGQPFPVSTSMTFQAKF